MAATVTHQHVSTVPPTPDPDLISSDDWNDTHTVTISAADVGAEASGAVATHAAASDPHADRTFATGAVSTHAAAADPHTGYVLESLFDAAGDLISASADNTPAKLTRGAQGTFLQAGSSTLSYVDVYIPVVFSRQGAVAVLAGSLRWYNDTGRTLTIASVRASVGTAPTGATLIVDVNKDGTTIYTTQGNRPAIATSGFTIKSTNPDVASIADGSYFTIDVDQVGSTVAGSDLTVLVALKG